MVSQAKHHFVLVNLVSPLLYWVGGKQLFNPLFCPRGVGDRLPPSLTVKVKQGR